MKNLLFAGLFLLAGTWINAQNITISGYVTDIANGESLIGVSVYTKSPRYGTVTNSYGFYSLSIPKGDYDLIISYVGYSTIQKKISLSKNATLNFSLAEASEELQEVIVTDKKLDNNLKTPEMGVAELSAKEINYN